jgi:hypothetical protein
LLISQKAALLFVNKLPRLFVQWNFSWLVFGKLLPFANCFRCRLVNMAMWRKSGSVWSLSDGPAFCS